MEEKERYEWDAIEGVEWIRDTKIGYLLNQQSKRIKELEKENYQLKQQLKDTEESYNNTMRYLNKTRSELLNLHKKI